MSAPLPVVSAGLPIYGFMEQGEEYKNVVNYSPELPFKPIERFRNTSNNNIDPSRRKSCGPLRMSDCPVSYYTDCDQSFTEESSEMCESAINYEPTINHCISNENLNV
eukprot:TRINITY_DN13801_c0_g1_i2.p1 TRINITY_DN13801_c0_g1~~TRINITY_DN13801_c0_g1_i2.p1  ORF type:complete len:108 (+),score=13.95 TRINITY_DN13801_c0_g1_i2:1-324(+)